jgi:hypothetical protein
MPVIPRRSCEFPNPAPVLASTRASLYYLSRPVTPLLMRMVLHPVPQGMNDMAIRVRQLMVATYLLHRVLDEAESRARYIRLLEFTLAMFHHLVETGANADHISRARVFWCPRNNWPSMYYINNPHRPPHMPADSSFYEACMFKGMVTWYWGWEKEEVTLDGMPARAPEGWAPRPEWQAAVPRSKPKTCRWWYNHCYRGRPAPCEQQGHNQCWYSHTFPVQPP